MIPITADQITLLAPTANASYVTAFANADTRLAPFGVNDNALRVAHFMAQVLHETGGLTVLTENLNYSAERLVAVWPSRFPTVADATPFARNPQALANKVYGGRMGNTGADDGFRFIGRGLLQLTGRDAYTRIGTALGIDLTGNPDLATDPQWCLQVAADDWQASGCNPLADSDDVTKVTKAINGGTIGLDSRQQWLVKTKNVWKSPSP